MPRKPRIEYAGAVYHVMCRGNRREEIFRDDQDRLLFLELMGEVCDRTGWVVHSYVLMGNHYHWLLETPEPNLSSGMRWFHGTYARRFCLRHHLVGHVFQGRFKSLVIDTEDPTHFRVVSDYIHLNPARARLLTPQGDKVRLRDYRWSSYPLFLKAPSRRPGWLEFGRLAGDLGYTEDSASVRRRYERYMERRAMECYGERLSKEELAEWDRVRRGWFLGGNSFRESLLERIPDLLESKQVESFGGRVIREHNERQAVKLIEAALPVVGCESLGELRSLRKSDTRKQAIVWLVKSHTTMPDRWVAETLVAGSRTMLHHAVRRFQSPSTRQDRALHRSLKRLTI